MPATTATQTMRAAFLYGPMDVRVEEVPAPRLERGDDVLIAVARTGICGSELHLIEGLALSAQRPAGEPIRSPLGHEYAGTVMAVGPEVEFIQVGQRVTVAPRGPCHKCDLCRSGATAICRRLTQRGGSWAETIVAPEGLVHPLPDDVPWEVGALTEPLSAAVRILDRAELRSGTDVCVIGAGPIGLFSAVLAKHAGAANVIVSDIRPSRRELALRMGIDRVVDPAQEDLDAVVRAHTGGQGVQTSIEAVGLEPALSQAIQVVARGGTVIWGGVAPVDLRVSISPNDLFMREVTLRTSWGGIELFTRTIRLLQSIDWRPAVAELFSLAQVSEAIHYARTQAAGKVLLQIQ